MSAKVKDTDNDGLLDLWEVVERARSSIRTGSRCRILAAMGAKPEHKDLFVEIGYLKTDETVTYGQGPDAKVKAPHSHCRRSKSLKLVYEAFKSAPVANPTASTGINVHFDVGNDYQSDPTNATDPTGLPPFIIHKDLARGGKNLLETQACADANGLLINCPVDPLTLRRLMPGQYPLYPGTVGLEDRLPLLSRRAVLKFTPGRKTSSGTPCSCTPWASRKEENEFLPGMARRPTRRSTPRGPTPAWPTGPAAII